MDKISKIIKKKKVKHYEYRLKHWINDGLCVVYRFDYNKKGTQVLPEIFKTNDKQTALKFMEEL